MAVFVLDRYHKPLMPCTEKRARLLKERGRAVVHRQRPYTIRLKDRLAAESECQPVALKIDPGFRTTGLALARVEATDAGEVQTVMHLAELHHRSSAIHEALGKRALARHRRRSAHLRYRKPRAADRRRSGFRPSRRSRVDNIRHWVGRFRRLVPVARLDVEASKFDPRLLTVPDEQRAYRPGELWGMEVRAYLLEKWGHQCAYCHARAVPLELDHILPKSRGGPSLASNLALSCRACNEEKGERSASEFGHPEVEEQAARSTFPYTPSQSALRGGARSGLVRALAGGREEDVLLPLFTWSGGRTRWNRARFGVPWSPATDALCVGEVAAVTGTACKTLVISARGRGRYCRTNFDKYGFPRGYLMRQKRVLGLQTGDLVRAVVPPHLKTAGVHTGRIAVRRDGFFRIGNVHGIPARFCWLLQRADGYDYALRE